MIKFYCKFCCLLCVWQMPIMALLPESCLVISLSVYNQVQCLQIQNLQVNSLNTVTLLKKEDLYFARCYCCHCDFMEVLGF